MNAGATAERVYAALKWRILQGEFRPGERLDPASLAETLSSSVTPVRDCLNTLRGEVLIESRMSEGFFMPHVNAPSLRDLYAWNDAISQTAVKNWPDASGRDPGRPTSPESNAFADATAVTFGELAERSGNFEHRRAIAAASDRLHAVRTIEARTLAGVWEELTALQLAIAKGVARDVRRLVVAYHRRRRLHADVIVNALYRAER